jgi:alanine racemase
LVHTAALAQNLARARVSAPDSRVFAVVKANAYGHGIERAFEGLRSADGFALLDLDDAQRVRNLGWRGPILLLEGAFQARDLEHCSRLQLWHVVHHEAQIDWLAAQKTERSHHVFLKLNSGMNRLGFTPSAFRASWARLNALAQVDRITLMTHFSDADGQRLGVDGIAHQVGLFESTTSDLPGQRSLANSAAILRHAQSALRVPGAVTTVAADWVRAGIMCYGSAPDFPEHDIGHWGLQPALTLRSQLIATQQLQAGDTVGYGSAFVAREPMRIGIVACGYADGYPRHAGNGAPILVDGVRTGTLGRVSMDMLAVDLTPVPQADVGTEVTLWGHGPKGSVLNIDEVAHAAGTIGYELMCALALRVPVQVA